ncbi:MAG: MBL fold metallo-hydrolase [Myxococcota bacterium]|nr:MBL fold metallo-hydrolase [Myxococcota bacterium]
MDPRVRSRGARRERVLASPRFRDGLFRNTARVPTGPKPGTRLEVVREFFVGGQRRRPPAPLRAHDPLAAWARPAETGFRATWLGHSTVLLELDGLRVLTDPVWSERISPFGVAAPRRFQPVPIDITALPPLDAIVISHDHFDHLDHGTVLALVASQSAPFVTSLNIGAYLEAWGVPRERIIELDWWEQATLCGGDLVLTATPSQHFSGRVGKRNFTLWSSFVIQSTNRRVFFSGDTALTPEFTEVGTRFGPFDLVMLEVGGFHPAWDHIHLGPANALAALDLLGGGRFMPVHWGTFNLALHAWDDPPETLLPLAAARGVELLMPRLGQAIEPTRGLAVEPWWRGTPDPQHATSAPRATVAG